MNKVLNTPRKHLFVQKTDAENNFFYINPRAKSFLCGIQAAFITLDIDMADELIRKRERSLKGAARAKLSRTKEFDHSKWVGGGMLDYRFSNARRIVNDIYAGEVSADV